MRILIGMPVYESVDPMTAVALFNLDRAGADVELAAVKGYGVARARNIIAQKALDERFDAVLMVDADVVPPRDALAAMIGGGFDIVLAPYPSIKGGCELFRPGARNFTDANRIGSPPQAVFGVKGGGLGCALIRTSVFKRMQRPWFRYVEYQNGSVLSEDLYFCTRASEAGIAIMADGRIRCGHMCRSIYQFERGQHGNQL